MVFASIADNPTTPSNYTMKVSSRIRGLRAYLPAAMRPNQALKLKGRTQEGLLGAALQFRALEGWLAATLRSTMGLRRLKDDPLPR